MTLLPPNVAEPITEPGKALDRAGQRCAQHTCMSLLDERIYLRTPLFHVVLVQLYVIPDRGHQCRGYSAVLGERANPLWPENEQGILGEEHVGEIAQWVRPDRKFVCLDDHAHRRRGLVGYRDPERVSKLGNIRLGPAIVPLFFAALLSVVLGQLRVTQGSSALFGKRQVDGRVLE